ncbi:SDR family NAD(P)-dependent oxidoreductase [Gramella sp. MAR_2010_147]|uniref:SDR family NAD(P)-dependent oxidoreductase n=1 Tax=Gramella sp. MAR_2010_147 TaxID=1250205 RepID=UPI00087B0EF5|nr:SDR family NAD(P)-dependent oxidoreductase [Gramella sp. MAR_2010_147]SDR92073.1 NAD(P)-dependent dehydrogenase, short-chain alcohol dehydrogenase family [Gramella sp. MAR_2010_147]
MKTIFITGSTDGIGKMTAIKLAKDGHEILLHGRNEEKLQKSVSEVKELSSNDNIRGFMADFSNFRSIESLIAEISEEIASIDVLINNAGIYKSPVETTQDSLDIRFAVNYFAPYLLTNGLVPILNKGDFPRVINLSSAAQATVSLKALEGNETLSMQEAYAQSKLALTMWSFNFAETHPEITTIAVNPGSLLNTKMVKETFGHHWSPADKGASILYEIALSEMYRTSSGKYYDNDQGAFNEAHKDAYDRKKIAILLATTKNKLDNN